MDHLLLGFTRDPALDFLLSVFPETPPPTGFIYSHRFSSHLCTETPCSFSTLCSAPSWLSSPSVTSHSTFSCLINQFFFYPEIHILVDPVNLIPKQYWILPPPYYLTSDHTPCAGSATSWIMQISPWLQWSRLVIHNFFPKSSLGNIVEGFIPDF